MEVEENAREVVKPVKLVEEGTLTVPTNGIKILGDEEEKDEEVSGILGGLPPPDVDKEVVPKSPISIIVRQPTVKAKKEQRGREEVEKMEVDQKEKEPVKMRTQPSPSRPVIGGGNVKRLSQGYEKLEATARGEDSTPVKQLGVVAEGEEEERGRGRLSSSSPRRRSRSRSPSQWRGRGVKQSSMDEIRPPPRSE